MADLKARIELYPAVPELLRGRREPLYIKLSDLSTRRRHPAARMASVVLPRPSSRSRRARAAHLPTCRRRPTSATDGSDAAARDRFAASLCRGPTSRTASCRCCRRRIRRRADAARARRRARRGEQRPTSSNSRPSALGKDRGRCVAGRRARTVKSPRRERRAEPSATSCVDGSRSSRDLVRPSSSSLTPTRRASALRAYLLGLPMLDALNAGDLTITPTAPPPSPMADSHPSCAPSGALLLRGASRPLKVPAAARGGTTPFWRRSAPESWHEKSPLLRRVPHSY